MTHLPTPPYGKEVRAKGWCLQLNVEQLRLSDTYVLCPREVRPWLHVILAVAWEQTPCGSLPENDVLIAARLEMPLDQFQQHRASLLRGWVKHSDERLYHRVMSDCVAEMQERRAKEASRKAGYRDKRASSASAPGMSHWTDAGQPQESHGSDDTGTGTGTIEPTTSVVGRARKQSRSSRRCPASFEVTADMQDWARTNAPNIDVQRCTEKFKDHEFKAGITDWPAAWRNWLRRDSDSARTKPEALTFAQRDRKDDKERYAALVGRGPGLERDYIDMQTNALIGLDDQ